MLQCSLVCWASKWNPGQSGFPVNVQAFAGSGPLWYPANFDECKMVVRSFEGLLPYHSNKRLKQRPVVVGQIQAKTLCPSLCRLNILYMWHRVSTFIVPKAKMEPVQWGTIQPSLDCPGTAGYCAPGLRSQNGNGTGSGTIRIKIQAVTKPLNSWLQISPVTMSAFGMDPRGHTGGHTDWKPVVPKSQRRSD